MKTVVFRTDASLQIGNGHVMRCLTLANALMAKGTACVFICRAHDGNLIDFIRDSGFVVNALPVGTKAIGGSNADWLGATWENDASQTLAAMRGLAVDWLIVDHYALDAKWEGLMLSKCAKLMVIDDLANRPHDCDLLLDQNLGRKPSDYVDLVPADCHLCVGPNFALLRPEFAEIRAYSLARRTDPQLKNLLITMGGVDQNNATAAVLKALAGCTLPEGLQITVVMGPHAPWLSDVQKLANNMPWKTSVKVGVKDMAQLMADSDLAIGAAGSTSWERCCLGLPSITLILADNQISIANALEEFGATIVIRETQESYFLIELTKTISEIANCTQILEGITEIATRITNGYGSDKIIEKIRNECK